MSYISQNGDLPYPHLLHLSSPPLTLLKSNKSTDKGAGMLVAKDTRVLTTEQIPKRSPQVSDKHFPKGSSVPYSDVIDRAPESEFLPHLRGGGNKLPGTGSVKQMLSQL